MTEVPLAESATDVVQKPQHIRFVQIKPCGFCDFLRTVGGGTTVFPPRTWIVGQSLNK